MAHPSKTQAWDHLMEETRMLHQYGYQFVNLSLERQHLRESLDTLTKANLTVAQIDALENVMYYAYMIGRDNL